MVTKLFHLISLSMWYRSVSQGPSKAHHAPPPLKRYCLVPESVLRPPSTGNRKPPKHWFSRGCGAKKQQKGPNLAPFIKMAISWLVIYLKWWNRFHSLIWVSSKLLNKNNWETSATFLLNRKNRRKNRGNWRFFHFFNTKSKIAGKRWGFHCG